MLRVAQGSQWRMQFVRFGADPLRAKNSIGYLNIWGSFSGIQKARKQIGKRQHTKPHALIVVVWITSLQVSVDQDQNAWRVWAMYLNTCRRDLAVTRSYLVWSRRASRNGRSNRSNLARVTPASPPTTSLVSVA